VRVRVRQHVNPLGAAFETLRAEVPALAPGRPVEVEIGCAEAQFLFERATRDPARTYIGIEIREAMVEWVNEQAREQQLPVQAVSCHAKHLLEIVPPGRAQRAYVNFPDPWFKRRHHKRRMIDDALARDIAAMLEPGGELFVQTDVWAIALDALDVFERAEAHFENLEGAWSFWKRGNPYGARSTREEDCERKGKPIWRLRYRRR
jgi:tRNA (guanine-N7-)-methyltransferase